MNKLQSFKIKKLHGYKDLKLVFKDNTLILVGENGAGKTTILKLLYYILSGQWIALTKYKFESICIKIDNKSYSFNRKAIEQYINLLEQGYSKFIPLRLRHIFTSLREAYINSDITLLELKRKCRQYNIPHEFITHPLEHEQVELFNNEGYEQKNIIEEINQIVNGTQILYLPTYRRIEQELSTIFKGIDETEIKHKRRFSLNNNSMNNYTELVEFGMKDVTRSIEESLNGIKDFASESLNKLTLGYLGDVVEKKYQNVDVSEIKKAQTETIQNILDRIDESILSQQSKTSLSDTIKNVKNDAKLDEHDKVICHYFIKLMNFQQRLEDMELKIRRFCEVCNKYMEDKTFKYDSPFYKFSISSQLDSGTENEILLDQLSSGEKQIVSLFCHLYLTDKKNYFVLIDEPELSLSVPWQRQFLVDIKKGSECSGLIAVTHSPFIYDNTLKQYAHGLGEFNLKGKNV